MLLFGARKRTLGRRGDAARICESAQLTPLKALIVEAGNRKEDGSMEMLDTKVRVDFKNKYPLLEDDSTLVPLGWPPRLLDTVCNF